MLADPNISRLALPIGLSLRTDHDEEVLAWEHFSPAGSKSTVEFSILNNSNADLRTQLGEISALHSRDFEMHAASNPVITAFFQMMLMREDVMLRRLENCSIDSTILQSANPNGSTTLSNVSLKSCAVILHASELVLSNVQIESDSNMNGGTSFVELEARKSSLDKVVIDERCVLLGDLGECIIEADCKICSDSVRMNFLKTEWRENHGASPLQERTVGIRVSRFLVTQKFNEQVGLTPISREEQQKSFRAIKERLDRVFG